MRLDYTLYVLAALILIISVVPYVLTIKGVESDTRSLWAVATVVLGLLSIGLGYSQRPKTAAQACQPALETSKEETKTQAEKVTVKKPPNVATQATATMELTKVKGIGEKRATQLKALGVKNVDDLLKSSVKNIAEKLKISPKIVDKWIDSAKELVK